MITEKADFLHFISFIYFTLTAKISWEGGGIFPQNSYKPSQKNHTSPVDTNKQTHRQTDKHPVTILLKLNYFK